MNKTIPAKTKVGLLEMIPLKNAETTYTFMAIITEKDNRLNLKKSDTVIKQVRRTGVPDSN